MKDLDTLLNELELHERFLQSGEGEDEIATPKFGDEQTTSKDVRVLAGMMHSSIYMAANVVRMMLGPTNHERVQLHMGDEDFARLKELGKTLADYERFTVAYMAADVDPEDEESPEEEEEEIPDEMEGDTDTAGDEGAPGGEGMAADVG